MTIKVRRLVRSDDRAAFDCGQADLNRFLRRFARQQLRSFTGVTYVAIDLDEDDRILGYVSVAAISISADELPKKLAKKLSRHHPSPALRLTRLAVDQGVQRGGIGKRLLAHTFKVAMVQAATVGCFAILVDAKADAIPFYEKYGFEQLEAPPVEGASGHRPRPVPMAIPMKVVERSLEPERP